MYFDYKNWRCQLRDRKIAPKRLVIGAGGGLKPGPLFEPYVKTETWFYHYCDPQASRKIKGRSGDLPPLHKGKPRKFGGWSYQNGYMQKWCQSCGAQAPHEVLEYFARALELWRLSAK